MLTWIFSMVISVHEGWHGIQWISLNSMGPIFRQTELVWQLPRVNVQCFCPFVHQYGLSMFRRLELPDKKIFLAGEWNVGCSPMLCAWFIEIFRSPSDLGFVILFRKWKWKDLFSHLRRNHHLFTVNIKNQPYHALPTTFAHHRCLCLFRPPQRLETIDKYSPLLQDSDGISGHWQGREEIGWVTQRRLLCLSDVPVLSRLQPP